MIEVKPGRYLEPNKLKIAVQAAINIYPSLNNIIFLLLLVFCGYFVSKYLIALLKKSKTNLLADNNLEKPQAFHEFPISIAGGICIFFSFPIHAKPPASLFFILFFLF